MTLWTVMRDKEPNPTPWGRITKASVSYADFSITECKITFAAPTDRLARAILATVVPEATPLDLGLDVLCGSLWIQDPRFGYDPQPLFFGNILEMDDSFTEGGRTLTVTMHDFKRLINLSRDLQDYQNLTDDGIAQMLSARLNEVLAQASGVTLGVVVIDEAARAERRTNSSVGAVRKYNARNQGRMLKATELDQLRVACTSLGFTIKVKVIRNPAKPTEAYQVLTIVPIGGALETVAGTYAYGDGEVISFRPKFTPPSATMQRNAMSKRFDAVNEILMLDNAKACVELDKNNLVRGEGGDILARGSITSPVQLTDAAGNHVTLGEYQQTTRPTFVEGLSLLGPESRAPLSAYEDRIAFRKGLLAPGQQPGPTQQSGNQPAPDYAGFVENAQETGELFWRFTADLETRFNPLLTTTDYLKMEGFGVWDGAWGIRSFSHEIGTESTTSFSLTFGSAVRSNG